jgi:hypothetical protein
MPPRQRSGRRSSSRSRRSKPIAKQFAELRRQLEPLLELRWLRKQLRRRRHRRNTPVPRQPSPLAQWFKRRLRRQQQKRRNSQPFNPIAWFWPGAVEGIATRDAAALVMRSAATVLLLLILISLGLSALPIRLTAPEWYLQVLLFIAENVPVLILASVFALLSLHVGPSDAAATAYRRRLLRVSRLLYIVAVLLVPLQIGFTVWLYGQAYSNDRTQLTAIRANADALIAGARQTNSKAEFLAYLRSRNFTGNLEAIEAAPLLQVRSEFIQTIDNNRKQQEQSLAQATRSTLLRYSVNALKLLATLVVFAGFLRGFYGLVRRTSLQQRSAVTLDPVGADPDSLPVSGSAD